jgi:UDP-N-acetylmuramate dehydrogenase
MMAATIERLIDRLPAVRGELHADVPLHRTSWFRAGGPAEVLFEPADRDDLAVFLAARPADVPVTVLGTCSNVIIRDGGIDGVVIRLGRGFMSVEIESGRVRAGAGAPDKMVARMACEASVAGLEFLIGVPGTIGGAVRMNAGAYGHELADIVASVEAVDAKGSVHELAADDLGFAYRHSALPEDWICTAATLVGTPGDYDAIDARMREIAAAREESQPIRARTGGSTFANPPGNDKAWELIDRAGCRGLVIGDAQVSEKHCNFLINRGNATAGDLEALGETVRKRVAEATGVTLDWEIRRLGKPAGGAP